MNISYKKLLHAAAKVNIIFGAIICILLLCTKIYIGSIGFMTGMLVCYVSISLKIFFLKRFLVEKHSDSLFIILVDIIRIAVISACALFFRRSIVGVICYCLGIAFSFCIIGFMLLRSERGSE